MDKNYDWVIVEFGSVPFLAYFRYNKEWCQRTSVYNYFDSCGQELIIHETDSLVAVNIKDIPQWKRRLIVNW